MSNKSKIENSVADLIKPKKNTCTNATVLIVKVKRLIHVLKKNIRKMKVCENPKFLESIKKMQLKQEKRKIILSLQMHQMFLKQTYQKNEK
jgi:hypothetical protein